MLYIKLYSRLIKARMRVKVALSELITIVMMSMKKLTSRPNLEATLAVPPSSSEL